MSGGRDQLGPLERITRILLALEAAEPVGVTMPRLLEIAEFGGSDVHQARQLKRDLDALNAEGWDIRNVAPRGETAVYRVFARDNRLRVNLTPAQQAELARAAQIAGHDSFRVQVGLEAPPADSAADAAEVRTRHPSRAADDDDLDKVVHATAHRCLLHFTYKQRSRVVHPHGVYAGPSGWYLVGNELGSDVAKQFVVDRMSDVRVDPPGTAAPPERVERRQLNPLTWAVDPPTNIVIETTADHEPEVERMLGVPFHRAESPSEAGGDTVRLTITVTNRSAFRARLYELGLRVRVLEPADVRAEIIAELEAVLGAAR